MTVSAVAASTAPRAIDQASNARTEVILHGPIVGTLLRVSWPNILVMLARQAPA